MKKKRPFAGARIGFLFAFTVCLANCDRWSNSSGLAARGKLDDAIQARTEAVALRQQIEATVAGKAPGETGAYRGMRKVIAQAASKQDEGEVQLAKDRYRDAATAYADAAKLYRQALDWPKFQTEIARAERALAIARMLAEASAQAEALAAPKKHQINAEGYLEAGRIDTAIAEMDKARQAYVQLVPGGDSGTLEQAIAARTALQSARDRIKDRLSFPSSPRSSDPTVKGPAPGSLNGLLGRAQTVESSAGEALDQRQYGPARALFAAAESLYHEAAALRAKHEIAAAARQQVAEAMKQADNAFNGEARPVSFELGKQAFADADQALGKDDIETAKPLLARALERFAAARAEADEMNALAAARQAWAAALAAADEGLLNQHAASQFQAAKAKAAEAHAKGIAAGFAEATAALKNAGTSARTKENEAQAAPVIARLETSIADKDKFGAEDLLAGLETLIPGDERMPALRERVTAVPGPKKFQVVDLGGGVTMPFVLLRPGSFTMGTDKGTSGKPAHKVTLTKPFYLGLYEVTQEQWERVMGSNPSHFKGAKNPVENVSWEDCQTFVAKLKDKRPAQSFRLPTEAEWEYACRAGGTGEYCYGDGEADLGDYAWYEANAGGTTHPVGQKRPNAWGLYDMHGNVWEWCADWYGEYPAGAVSDPQGPAAGSRRALRGGAWGRDASWCRAVLRGGGGSSRSDSGSDSGFRLACALPP